MYFTLRVNNLLQTRAAEFQPPLTFCVRRLPLSQLSTEVPERRRVCWSQYVPLRPQVARDALPDPWVSPPKHTFHNIR